MIRASIILIVFLFIPTFVFGATGGIDPLYTYAWGDELGWVNFAPTHGDVVISDTAVTGYIWSSVYGWINLSPAEGGVLHNGTGALSGSAWGENAGWIDFTGVTINTATGKFLGTAVSDSVGTITFNCSTCDVRTTWRPSSEEDDSDDSGGGGSRPISSVTGITISGRAYPLSKVTVLKDGVFALSTLAGPDARFSATLSGLQNGTYSILVYTEDAQGNRSDIFSAPITFTRGASTSVSGVFLAPTISVDKKEVKYGENIALFGQSVPAATVTISVHSPEEIFVNTVTDSEGVYLYNLDTTRLSYGEHVAKSKVAYQNNISNFGGGVHFSVGDTTVSAQGGVCPKGDVSGDCKVNLIDFSLMAFWYERDNPPTLVDLTGDGRVTLSDISILVFNWTG